MIMRMFLLLASVAVLASAASATEDDVLALTADTFKTEVPNENTFVMFYAPW